MVFTHLYSFEYGELSSGTYTTYVHTRKYLAEDRLPKVKAHRFNIDPLHIIAIL